MWPSSVSPFLGQRFESILEHQREEDSEILVIRGKMLRHLHQRERAEITGGSELLEVVEHFVRPVQDLPHQPGLVQMWQVSGYRKLPHV